MRDGVVGRLGIELKKGFPSKVKRNLIVILSIILLFHLMKKWRLFTQFIPIRQIIMQLLKK